MKVVAVNGSHKGVSGNTSKLVSAFLAGTQTSGAEIVSTCLLENDIKYCLACKACWFNHPGKCVINDDMCEIISQIKNAEILVLATPIYFDNISGLLKIFIDRMMVLASPYWTKDRNGECRHLLTSQPPQLVLLANCGYPERSHFQVVSHWINRVARNMGTELLAEIYASQGALLSLQDEAVKSIVDNYLSVLSTAGLEIARDRKLSETTKKFLAQNFIPDENYLQGVQKHINTVLEKSNAT